VVILRLNWADVGSRIRSLWKKNYLTIERLSELLEVSTSIIGLVEKGDSGVSADNLLALAHVFKVPVDYLLTGENVALPDNNKNRFETLETYLYDYTDEEIAFLLELAKFLKNRVDVRHDKSASAE